MKWLVGLIAIASMLVMTCPSARADSGIAWASTYADAQTLAKAENKLILVDVYTDWCGWSKKMDSDVYPDPDVVKAVSQFVPVKMNADQEGQDLAAKYNVTGYPTILVLDANGKLQGQIVGYLPAPQFAAELNQYQSKAADLNQSGTVPNSSVSVVELPADGSSPAQIALAYARKGDVYHAMSVITELARHQPGSRVGTIEIQIGDALIESGDNSKALLWFRKSLAGSSDPQTQVAAHLGMATAYLNAQDVANARAQLHLVLRSHAATAAMKADVRNTLQQL